MSQNFGKENQTLIYDELDSIYQNKTKNSTEREVSPISERIYLIGESLAVARDNFLNEQSSTHEIDKKNFIKATAKKLFNRVWMPETITKRSLIIEESKIGAMLLGDSTPRKRVEFFNEDREHWFYYQGLIDPSNLNVTLDSLTTHYEVLPDRILRVDDHKGKTNYNFLDGAELENFLLYTEMYHNLVMNKVYNTEPTVDKKLQ